MNMQEQTARLQAANKALIAKGFNNPRTQIEHSVDVDGTKFASWIWYAAGSEGQCEDLETHDSAEAAIDAIDKHISNLKTPQEVEQHEFMAALGRVIDKGRQAGIEVGFMNPLEQAMKDLSKNIITDQR